MNSKEKPLVWLTRERVKTPPFSKEGRKKAGDLLRQLQQGGMIQLPRYIKPLKKIGERCYELRITDNKKEWRIICRLDPDAIVIAEVFLKKTNKIPKEIIDACKQRLRKYDEDKNDG